MSNCQIVPFSTLVSNCPIIQANKFTEKFRQFLPPAEPSAAPWRGYNSLDLVLYFPTYVQWGGVGLGILYFIVYINGIVKVSGV